MRFYNIILVVFVSFIYSCRKFVTIPPPTNQLVTESVFDDNASATAAQTAIYSQMEANYFFYTLSLYNGLSSDELVNFSSDLGSIQFYQNAISPAVGTSDLIWSPAYNYIYQANAIIQSVENNNLLDSRISKQLSGESYFLRSLMYFYLTNLYGDVPLITGTDYKTNSSYYRTSQVKVYTQIISDLKQAELRLNDNYVDASDTAVTLERTRPNRWAASSLLARVYLYTDSLNSAISKATEVINNSNLYSLDSDLNNVFLANNTEAIWQLQSVVPGINTPEGYNFILNGIPTASAISSGLLNSFELGDQRRIKWIDSISVDTSVYYYPFKYKVQYNTNVTEYSMILRLAELYLIRAEAEANNSDLVKAADDLNIIRNRAGLANLSFMSQTDLLKAILHERKIEFFTENGHRWLDLKRTGSADSVMSVVTPIKGGTWNSNWSLYPIPQSERNNDPNLTQNQGY